MRHRTGGTKVGKVGAIHARAKLAVMAGAQAGDGSRDAHPTAWTTEGVL